MLECRWMLEFERWWMLEFGHWERHGNESLEQWMLERWWMLEFECWWMLDIRKSGNC